MFALYDNCAKHSYKFVVLTISVLFKRSPALRRNTQMFIYSLNPHSTLALYINVQQFGCTQVPKTYAEGILKERIVSVLRQHPEGLTTHDISQLIGTHRHTATRYLAELKGAEIIHCRIVGPAVLHYLDPDFSKKVASALNRMTNKSELLALGGAK